MKKGIALVLAIVMVFSLTGCGSQNNENIDVSNGTQTEGTNPNAGTEKTTYKGAILNKSFQLASFTYVTAAAKQSGSEYGLTIDVFDGGGDQTKVADAISTCVANGYDVIFVNGDSSLVSAIQEANAAGIPVINYNSVIEGDCEFAGRIYSDDYAHGQMLGELFINDVKEKNSGSTTGTIACVLYPSLQNCYNRGVGFMDYVRENSDLEILEYIVNSPYSEPTSRLVDDILVAYPTGKLDYIFGINSGIVLGALASCQAADRGEIGILGFDNEDDELNAIADPNNQVMYVVSQNRDAIGTGMIDIWQAYLKSGKTQDDVKVGADLITIDNVKEYKADQDARVAELNDWIDW